LAKWEATCLIKPFTKIEIKAALDEMKTNIVPAPDVLTTNLYRAL
jgi:hypothetical protein